MRDEQKGNVVSSWALGALLEAQAVFLQAALASDLDGQPADPEESRSGETDDPQAVKPAYPQQKVLGADDGDRGDRQVPLPSALDACQTSRENTGLPLEA